MPRRTTQTRKAAFRVANPKGIRKGKHIISIPGKKLYEGDSFQAFSKCDVDRLIRDGLIEEVR